MRIVVTGASGFIGGALVDVLAQDEHAEAVAVARRPLSAPPGVECVRVRDYGQAPGGDVLVHLAESPAVDAASDAPGANVLNSLFDGRYGRAIYASTQLVYGDATARPHLPSEAVVPSNPYTIRKRQREEQLLAFGGAVARLANVYGPGMTMGTVVSDILAQIPGTGPINVGNEDAVRDFVWVSDVAAGLAAMAHGTATGIFNLGTGLGTTVLDVARLALDRAGEPARHVQAAAHRPSAIVVDIAATTAAFGWRPAVPLAAGLAKLIEAAA